MVKHKPFVFCLNIDKKQRFVDDVSLFRHKSIIYHLVYERIFSTLKNFYQTTF